MIEGLFQTMKSFLPDSELGSVDEVRLLDVRVPSQGARPRCDISQRCDFTCLREDDSASGSYCECCWEDRSGSLKSRCRGKCRWRRQGTRRRSRLSLRDELWNVVSSINIRASEEDDALLCPRLLLFGT
jgi:hypothetical protein